MQKIALANTKASLVASTVTPGTPGWFGDGSPPGDGPSEIGADWLNGVQMELSSVVDADGTGPALNSTGVFTAQIYGLWKGAYALASQKAAASMGAVTTLWRRIVIASSQAEANGVDCAIMASGGPSTDSASVRSAAIGCDAIDIAGGAGAVAIASGSDVLGFPDSMTGVKCATIASADSTASSLCTNAGTRSAVIACDRSQIDAGTVNNAQIASEACASINVISGAGPSSSGTFAAKGCEVQDSGASALRCAAAIASEDSSTRGSRVAAIACYGSAVRANQAAILASDTGVILTRDFSVAGGAGGGTPGASGTGLGWRLDSDTGDITGAGTVATGDANADYAELFENAESGKLPVGALVARDGAKVRLARPGDRLLGVASASPAVLGNAAELHWYGAFVRDEWGRRIVSNGKLVRADGLDTDRAYVPRRERDADWTAVGLIGQLRVRVDATVKPDRDVVAGPGGVGTVGTWKRGAQVECMAILSPFDADRGYAIALCLVR